MSESKPTILLQKSYLTRVRDSIGTKMFRSLYVLVDGKEVDILDNGQKSCALFVSSILIGFGLIKTVHATVESTISDMESSGWLLSSHPMKACVVIWKDYIIDSESHLHIGFYIGDGMAISNSSSKGFPHEHECGIHQILKYLWHPRLEN